MGFYIRRSVRVGPFRFNLSTSGLGLSVGVKGFRVGTGPRGNYVHMGRGGLYFRSGLPVSSPPVEPLVPSQNHSVPHGEPVDETLGAFQEIESANALQLTDSSSTELVQQIASKSKVPRLLPWGLVVGVVSIALLVGVAAPPWGVGVAAAVAVLLCLMARRRDVTARAVVLLYDLDDNAQEAYGSVHAAFEALQASGRVWHVDATAAVRDRKYHAGANNVIKRETIGVRKGEPPILKTNIEAVLLPAGRQLLAFMPDRLLVFDGDGVAGINYKNLTIQVEQSRFIESDTPPQDAKIVDTTWRYVNKKGGPDRRFANNQQLPVALYEEIQLGSASGLNELFQCSRLGVGKGLQEAVVKIAKITDERKGV